MLDTAKWIVGNVSSDFLQIVFVVLFCFVFRQMNGLKKLMLGMKNNYEQHIAQSRSSDRENIRSKLRKLHMEMSFLFRAKKDIPDQLVEEFYCAFGLYRELGGNGYIKHLKEEIDSWLDMQRENKTRGGDLK